MVIDALEYPVTNYECKILWRFYGLLKMKGLIMITLITRSTLLTLSFTENYSNNIVYHVDKENLLCSRVFYSSSRIKL